MFGVLALTHLREIGKRGFFAATCGIYPEEVQPPRLVTRVELLGRAILQLTGPNFLQSST